MFGITEKINSNTTQMLAIKNINPTTMRMLVLDLLLKQKHALSLTDLEKMLYPSDRTTIYRTLKTFEKNGLIHLIDDGTGAPKYALCPEECDGHKHYDLHVHFYCSTCRETFCLPNIKIPEISLPVGFISSGMKLVVKGVCDSCKTNAIPLH